MAQKTDIELSDEALIIRNETEIGANTALRVGDMLKDIVDSKSNKDSGGSQTLDQVLENGSEGINKYIDIRNDDYTIYTEIGTNYFYAEDTANTNAAVLTPSEMYVENWVANKGTYIYNDNIQVWDVGNYSQLKKDRLIYHYADTGAQIDLIFPAIPNQSVEISIPSPSVNSEIALVENTVVWDLSNGSYTMTTDGIFEFSNTHDNKISFPDPTLFNGKKITIINTDGANTLGIDGNNPLWIGGNTQIILIGAYQMLTFVSINGNWRGGLLVD